MAVGGGVKFELVIILIYYVKMEEPQEEEPQEEEFIYNDADSCSIDDSFDILGSIADFEEIIEKLDTEEDIEIIIHKPPILRGTKRISVENEN